VLPQRCCQGHDASTRNAASRGPATGRGGFVPLVEIDDKKNGNNDLLCCSCTSKQLFRLLASLLKAALLKIDRGKGILAVARST
jgi:hypothetical protein